MSVMSIPKSLARGLLHTGGFLGRIRSWNRHAVRILMYHDFPSDPEVVTALERQCAHINQHYQVVSMTDVGRYLREGASLPENALAVTIDDGGRDFLQTAQPIFKAHRIPVTVYVVSGFLDKQLWLWWDQVKL